MKTVSKIFAICPLIMILAACSEQKKLDEMHDSTQNVEQTTAKMNQTTSDMSQTTLKMSDTTSHMSQTTDSMSKTTDSLSVKTEEMKNTTNELYDSLRQGNTLQLRRDGWKAVLEAPTMYKKISEATKYFMSYEVQLWNQYAQDITLEKRDLLAQQAAKEYFMEIEDLAPKSGSVDIKALPDGKDPLSDTNRTASFNAFCITMDQMNRKQVTTVKKVNNAVLMSMESIMEDSLLAKDDYQKNSDKLGSKIGYIKEVLLHEKVAVQILQTRYNMFIISFIDNLTHISNKGLLEKLQMITLGWDLDLSQINLASAQFYNYEVLQKSIDARNLLVKLGYKPELDTNVKSLLQSMKIKQIADTTTLQGQEQARIVNLLNDLKK